ncbi:MAG: excinuclease ABC subunit UvrC [bacterium]|nr:excinuclease ABC subunit UvrC [bacterium]
MNKFSDKLALVPNKPGSYQMKNKDGVIIYVGKAKNLKRRLSSYFNRTQTGKTLMLVNDIHSFEYIVTSTEIESLILEITLIKKYNPKYNILLKDDKSYPYIEFITKPYPILKVVRNVKRKKNVNKLFGPYPNVKAAKKTVEILNRIYPLKKCINTPKKECLYYHIGECLGYCINNNLNTVDMCKDIVSFLKGNSSIVTDKIKEEMTKASNSMNYEKALDLKNMLNDIEITLSKQKIDLNTNEDFDMVNYYYNDNYIAVVIFFIRGGLLFGRDYKVFEYLDNEEDNIIEYIINFYDKSSLVPKKLYVPNLINCELLEEYLKIPVLVPVKGKIHNLLNMCYENAKAILEEKQELIKKNDKERYEAIESLRQILKLDKLHRIESFDNSHLFGTYYVGGMVVFDDFLPNKSEYRKYKIDALVKDDLSAMKEVIYRRYYKVLMENLEKPDLIVVDGGKLQVSVAKDIIDSLGLNIKVVGLAKNDKHKTNMLFDSDLTEINLDSKSKIFLFLSKIQEEVHRYAISYHREIKSKGMLSSILDMAPNIGEVRKKALLKKFGSVKKIKEATIDDLEEILSKDIAQKLYFYLKELD